MITWKYSSQPWPGVLKFRYIFSFNGNKPPFLKLCKTLKCIHKFQYFILCLGGLSFLWHANPLARCWHKKSNHNPDCCWGHNKVTLPPQVKCTAGITGTHRIITLIWPRIRLSIQWKKHAESQNATVQPHYDVNLMTFDKLETISKQNW